jgi:hypothetical protein
MCEFCGLANPNDVAKCRGCWKWRPKVVVQLAELGIEEVQIEKVTSIRQSRDGSFVTDDDSDISSVSEGEPPDDPSVGSDLFEKVSRPARLQVAKPLPNGPDPDSPASPLPTS